MNSLCFGISLSILASYAASPQSHLPFEAVGADPAALEEGGGHRPVGPGQISWAMDATEADTKSKHHWFMGLDMFKTCTFHFKSVYVFTRLCLTR